jgi:hypothetical protein
MTEPRKSLDNSSGLREPLLLRLVWSERQSTVLLLSTIVYETDGIKEKGKGNPKRCFWKSFFPLAAAFGRVRLGHYTPPHARGK